MTDLHSYVAQTYTGLADVLGQSGPGVWDIQSLCEKWAVRHVVAHVTMPVRLTPEQFGAEMAAAGGDFTAMSDAVALRDGDLPESVLLDELRSDQLHAWDPPGGGAIGAVSHAVIHSLDITIALDRAAVAPPNALLVVADHLTATGGTLFETPVDGLRIEATDADWHWGNGHPITADAGSLVALLSGRELPDGRTLRRN